MLQILHILCFTDVNSETETHFFLVKFLNSTSEYISQKRQVFEFLIQRLAFLPCLRAVYCEMKINGRVIK